MERVYGPLRGLRLAPTPCPYNDGAEAVDLA